LTYTYLRIPTYTHIYSYIRTYIGKSVPFQAWSGPEGSRKLRFPDYMTMAQDGGKVVSLTYRPPLFPGNTPGTHFFYRLSRPQDHSAIGRILCQWKFQVTSAGIEPATFRFVVQCHISTSIYTQSHILTIVLFISSMYDVCKRIITFNHLKYKGNYMYRYHLLQYSQALRFVHTFF